MAHLSNGRFLQIYRALPEIASPPNYDYTDLEEGLGNRIGRITPRNPSIVAPTSLPQNMYDRLLIIKKNLTKENFNKMVNDLDAAYIPYGVREIISNKEYGFLGDNDNWHDTQFMQNLELPKLNNTASEYDKSVDSLTQNLSVMSVNENPWFKRKYYIKLLVELSRAYYYNKDRGFGNERVLTLTSLYILSNHYFDKMEELFRKYTASPTPEGLIQNNIIFYKSLIKGRNAELTYGYTHSLITMIFDFEFKLTDNSSGLSNYEEVKDSAVYKKDLLYKRLEKSKKELTDSINRKESRKAMSDSLQAQSKYIPLIRDRHILKNIINEMKEDSDVFPEQLGVEIDNVALNMPTDVLFQLVTNNLEDEQIEQYFLESLYQQDSKGLKKLITLFQPNNIKLNSSSKNKVVQLFELFKQRGNENEGSLSGSLAPETLKHIYEYADIGGGSKKKRYTLKKKNKKASKTKTKTKTAK